MSDQRTTLVLEIPATVVQQDVWNVVKNLEQVEGVTAELQEPKDFVTPTLLFLHFAASHIGQIATIAGGVKATHDTAKCIYDFLHPANKEKTPEQGKNKVVIIKKGKRIELYNLSTEDIVKILQEK